MPQDELREQKHAIQICGDDILGISFESAFVCQSVAEQLRHAGGWLESVAGIDSVVVQFDAATVSLEEARDCLNEQLSRISTKVHSESQLIEVPVCYGNDFGPDFESVSETLGLSAEQLKSLHSAGEYCVEMLGFTPGFAYVGGLPAELSVPRLSKPRQRVEAGSIGIADGHTGLYALPGPGGWSLIGRTPMRLFDPTAEPPFLLSAGARVRFNAIDAETFRRLNEQ